MSDPLPSPPPQQRRLAAVVFTDVVGYSARMERDEAATISGVEADLGRMRMLCVEHGGEVLNSMGDGLMLCFPSVVKGVNFALKVQGEFAARKTTNPDALEHRIGIHLGDVVALENGSVAGDGVNIASRLEAKAPPGGICMSQIVYETVKGKVSMQATFIGPQSFKNIAQPIPIWHVRPECVVGSSDTSTSKLAPSTQRRHAKRWLISGVSALLVLSVVASGWYWSRRDTTSAPPAGKADLALADSKSIAVLPFTNMSDNKENAYFADGMQEELLTQLALLSELKVVSRTSVMDYRDTKKNVRQIGTELGVRTLVEGSVRRAEDVVRVTVQLIDAGSDKHLWAQSYERKLKDIFAIQNELATEIARALKVSLTPSDHARLAKKPTESLAAYDLLLRHQELVNRFKGTVRSVSAVNERITLLSKAVELDPTFALAWARLGADHARAYYFGIDRSPSRLIQAKQAIERAQALAPDDIEVQIEEGTSYQYGSNDYRRAAQTFENVLRIAPNNVDARLQLAFVRRSELNWAEYAAQLEKVLAIDVRNVDALSSYALLLWNFRKFDRALAVQQQLINIRPDDLDLQARYQRIEHWKSGSWDSFDKWRSTLPPGVERTLFRVWILDLDRAIAGRDLDGALRLLDAAPQEFLQLNEWQDLNVSLIRALIFRMKGDRSRAIETARTVLGQATAKLRGRTDDPELLYLSYFSHAILGQRDAALAEHRRAHTLALASKDRLRADNIDKELASLHALVGDREQALQEISRRLKLPGSLASWYRIDPTFVSLWDDPKFLAIVNDPANNAPLSFYNEQTPAMVK